MKNANISIGNYKGKLFVSQSIALPAQISQAGAYLLSFHEVLDKVDVDLIGKVEIKRENGSNYRHVIAVVDNVEYLKLSFYPETGWIVGFSVALPKEVGLAKTVVAAMDIAFSMV